MMGTPPNILIVDDEAVHMRALCDILGRHDYKTTGLISGEAALEKMQTETFDLLLSDLMMPGIDGITLVQAASKIDSNLACIIMTGEGSIASAVQAMKVGAHDYIVKPFKVSAILPVLARALETRRLRMENVILEQRQRAHTAELNTLNSELELAKKEAERANHEKSNFLSHMSHELRTPLNSILGFAQILQSESISATPEERKKFLRNIENAGKHLLTLINEILDLAQIESGFISISLEPIQLAKIFEECRAMISPIAEKFGIRMIYPEYMDVLVFSDKTRLKQVLINLLSNAIKYNNKNGSVTLDYELTEVGRIRLFVIDTGIGLSAEQLKFIFQPFNRLGREKIKEEGTGIGLSLTKKIVEAMQAEIGVASKLDIGSTFWIELPVHKSTSSKNINSIGDIISY
ncbi:Signal transduction histidine kinase [Rhodoferax sp. OV413]|nr:Signal transduction histidine kinase [Rhodoferax sp. OV413]